MKGDFSRETFRPANRYTSVRLQQGRILLDSDWNEQAAIREHSERVRFEEVVGRSGVPDDGGMAVRVGGDGTLELSAGRAYAGGLACVLDRPTPLAELMGELPVPEPGRTDLVYLDAWERHLTALDEPAIRETALGGPDTTTRLRVAWKPVLVEDIGDPTCEEIDGLVARPGAGMMRAAAPGGYLGVENNLYRVEIHDGGDLGAASFKWSRDNGSVVFGIEALLGPNTVRLAPESEPRRRLGVGDWVEISGEASELGGRAGTLARVESTGADGHELTFDRPIGRHRDEPRPRARLWDQRDAATLATSSEWLELESGIEVRFSAGDFRSGDYWTIPARTATGTIEWPEDDQPPHGPEHGSCPLALVTWERSSPVLRDCRRVFSPLTELRAELARLATEVAELRQRLDA
jgi:Family of unknown function (DUF6519)